MKKIFNKQNFFLLLLTIAFTLFGCLMIYDASGVAAILRYDVPTNYFVKRQILSSLLGYAATLFIIVFPTKNYKYFTKIAMFLATLALVLLFVLGTVAGGALSWYEFGKLNFQPSEFAKLILILYLAVYYNKLKDKKNISFFQLFKPIIWAALLCLLIAIEPDMGSAIIIFLITVGIFIAVPLARNHKKKVYLIGLGGIVLVGLCLLLFGNKLLHSYQVSRLLNFTKPCTKYYDASGSGFQVCNGYIAIHNGGVFGVGLGNSTQKNLYLPEAHTDFIFPIICEELGLIAGIIIIVLYMVMLLIILNIAKNATNLKNSLIAYGIFVYFSINIFVNLLGILGLIPLTGIPLPFLSYGGTYNLCVLVAMALVQRVNIESKIERDLCKIKDL